MNQSCGRRSESNFDSKNINPQAKLHVWRHQQVGREEAREPRMGKARVCIQGEGKANVFCIPFSLVTGLPIFHISKQTAIFCSWNGPTVHKLPCLVCTAAFQGHGSEHGMSRGSTPSPLPAEKSPPFGHCSRHQFAKEINASRRSGQQRSQFNATVSV